MPVPLNMPAVNQELDTVILDDQGQPVVTVGMRTFLVHEPDGSITKRKISQNIALADGSIWNPSLSMPPKPAVVLALCDCCRNPPWRFPQRAAPSHGLISRARAKTCASCGHLCCPKHGQM